MVAWNEVEEVKPKRGNGLQLTDPLGYYKVKASEPAKAEGSLREWASYGIWK